MISMILFGLAAWIATSTIVEAEVFRDVREAIERLHTKHDNWWTYKLRYLIKCHMCTGIWVSALIALFVPALVPIPVIGWGLTALSIKGIAHLFLVVQKLGEAITTFYNREEIPEEVEIVSEHTIPLALKKSHLDEMRALLLQETSRKKNVGWPNDDGH